MLIVSWIIKQNLKMSLILKLRDFLFIETGVVSAWSNYLLTTLVDQNELFSNHKFEMTKQLLIFT